MPSALDQKLTRAIGVSNYKTADLKALEGPKPSVNQCQMSIAHHDDDTIGYCQANGIVYESYQAMKGCPFTNPALTAIATKHGKSAAQVCLRWVLQKGAIMAVGLGGNASKMAAYSKENLDLYGFNLTASEMALLDSLKPKQVEEA